TSAAPATSTTANAVAITTVGRPTFLMPVNPHRRGPRFLGPAAYRVSQDTPQGPGCGCAPAPDARAWPWNSPQGSDTDERSTHPSRHRDSDHVDGRPGVRAAERRRIRRHGGPGA